MCLASYNFFLPRKPSFQEKKQQFFSLNQEQKPRMLLRINRESVRKLLPVFAAEGKRSASTAPVKVAGGKPKVVIIGGGWGGYNVVSSIDQGHYDVKIVSPRNHYLF